MKTAEYKLVARIYMNTGLSSFQSEFAHVGVNFNFINSNSTEFEIDFLSHWELPKSKVGLDKIQIDGQLGFEPMGSIRPGEPYGYFIESSEKNLCIDKAEIFLRHGRLIRRKLAKMADDCGYPANMKEYLVQVFKAMGVSAVLFEAKSEADGFGRWKQYPVASTGELIEEAVNIISAERGWDLAEAI